MTTSRGPLRALRRRPIAALLAVPLLSAAVFAGFATSGAPAALAGPEATTAPELAAGQNAHGLAQVVINPGGGHETSGIDGLRVVLNSTGNGAATTSDQLWFANTRQFCCSGVGPMLNVGGTLFGENSAAAGSTSWTDLTLVSSAGNVSSGATLPSTTGSGSATLRYTATKGGLVYTINRTVAYTYPNDYVTETYVFTIPAGNTDAVKFYQGGDTAPGSSDQGYGIQLTSPVRSVISLNTSSQIQVGIREVPGSKAFDGATSQSFSTPYPTVQSGGDIGFVTLASNHDAGYMMQWNLGTTPGTQTYALQTFVNFQGASLTAGFRSATEAVGTPVLLDLNVVNTALSATPGIGYTFTLPTGLTVATGTPANACGGTLTAAVGSSTITLAGGTVPLAANCLVSVPVVASGGGSYAISSSSVTGLAVLTNGVGSSTLTATGPVVPPAPSTPGAPTSVTAVADESSILVSWQPPATGSTPARYRVTASPGSASCTTTGLSCVLGGVAGTSYTITVVPLTAGGVEGTSASVTTAAVEKPAIPAAPPADAPLTLTTTDGQITKAEQGQQITVVGTGFLPYSTATIVIYSTPIDLGTVTTDGTGSFSKQVTIPAGLEAGSHSLLAYGVDSSGNTHSLRLNITVDASGAVTSAAVARNADGSLAYTGSTFDPAPVVVGGVVLLVAGVLLLVVVRRRRTGTSAAS